MDSMTTSTTPVIGGVDTHLDLHFAAAVTPDGTVIGTKAFPTTRHGYRLLLAWMRSHGTLKRVGVECTGTYGAGLVRLLGREGVPVLEVTGPDPSARRAKGKDDTLDAIAAARAAASGQRVQVAKNRNGQVEALRVLRTTRKTAVRCRRATLQQLHNTIVAAPENVRDELRHLTRMKLIRTLAASRPNTAAFRDQTAATRHRARSRLLAASWSSTTRSPASTR